FGGEFKWNIDGMFSDTDKLVHYQEELAKINEEIELLNTDDPSEADKGRLAELNEQADGLLQKINEVQSALSKTTFDEATSTINDNGGIQQLYKTYSWMKDKGMDGSEISKYITQNTGLDTEQEIKLYTDEAQRNVEALQKKIQDLKAEYSKGNISKEEYEAEFKTTTQELQDQGIMLEMLNEVLLEDAGVSTEETVSEIASILSEISGYVSTIAGKESGDKPNGTGSETNNGSTKKPAPTYTEVKQNTFTEPISTKTSFKDSVVMKVDADTGEFDKKVTESNTLADMLNTPRKMPVSASGLNSVNNELSRADRLARVLTGKTHLINFEYRVTGNPPTIPTSTGSGGARGNAFARGNDIVGEQGRELVVDPNRGIWYTVGDSGTEMIDLPKDAIVYSHNQTEALLKSGVTTRGKSKGRSFANGNLVGERGRELIVDPNNGIWYTVGDYGSEMVNLPKDAIVYNHQQTEDLLKNGHTGRGHSTGASFAEGNAYASSSGRNDGSSKPSGKVPKAPKTYTGGSKSAEKSAKAAEKAAKSAEKAADSAKKSADEAKQTIDWIERAIEVQNRALKKQKDIYENEYEGYDTRLTAVDQYREQLEEKLNVLTEALDRRNEKMFENEQELIKQIGDQDKAEVILKRVLEGDVDP
ncbi:MAG: hypothetical protein J6O49_11915, partial [Bacteroidaceae bacterium]|nr:hypothetical protein [Bacteroidaceae bacterium]